MTAKYLLPCACGQQTTVEPRQAGETIPCGCGKSLQVPTLLDMTALEPAPPESVPGLSRSTWGLRHQLQLLGIVLVLATIAGGVWLYFERPISRFHMLNPKQLRQSAEELSPLQTWEYWEMMKQGLDRRIDEEYADDVRRFHLWRLFFGALALLGIVLIVAGTVAVKE